MSTLIQSLHEIVTPKVLRIATAQAGSDENKTNALELLYRLFATRLANEEVVSNLAKLSNDELQDGEKLLSLAMTGKKTGETDFLVCLYDNVGEKFALPSASVSALATAALPLVFSHVKSLAGSKTIAAYVGEEKESLISGLPNWLTALLPAGLLGAFAAIGTGIGSVAHGAVGAVGSVASGVGSLAGKAVDGVSDAASSVASSVGSIAHGAADVAGKAVDGVAGAAGAVAAGIGSVASGAADVAGKAVHGVADGASKVAGAVGDELKDLKDGVSSAVNSATSSGGGFMKSLLPIIGVIILAGLAWLMLKGCQKDPAPVAAPKAAEVVTSEGMAALSPAILSLGLNETGDKLLVCRGTTGGSLGEQWKAVITGVFAGGDCQFDTKDTIDGKSPVTEPALAQILGFMKGVPDATVSINDKTVRFNSSNPEALQKLIADVKTAFPDLTVEAEPALNVEEAVKNSIDAAKTALDGLGDTATTDDLVRALNLQIINFASASADIPVDNQAVLDKAAEHLKALPDAKLLITGHTDSQGKFEANQALSERRAKAVHDYLVSKGVSDDKLEIKGASSSNPVATNATEQGRFANRRIEFTVFQDGEVVTEVGSTAATATKAPAEQPKPETTETK